MSSLQNSPWLSVIGIGDDGLAGLTQPARARLDAAEILVGGVRHLDMLPDDSRMRVEWPTPLGEAIEQIAAFAPQSVAVLATGDPMWFGIGNTLARRFGADQMAVYPAISAFSLAAARLLWPLGDVVCLSLHGRAEAPLEPHITPGNRILILSRDGTTPGNVASRLRARGFGPSPMVVLEHMGGKAERACSATAAGFDITDIASLNVIAVTCKAGPEATLIPRTPGLDDCHYENDGQLTHREVRAVTLARLMPLPGQRLWDIGAGSGSISVEWLRAAPCTEAIAIEPHAARAETLKTNTESLGVTRLDLVVGSAPEALADLPEPDAVFIGGGLATGGENLIELARRRLRPGGRLVANAVTTVSEVTLLKVHSQHGGDLCRISVARAEPLGPHLGWRPFMPVTQWVWQKTWEEQ